MNKRKKKDSKDIKPDISNINDEDVIKYLDESVYNDPGFMNFYKGSNDPKLQCANILVLTSRWYNSHSNIDPEYSTNAVNAILNWLNTLICVIDKPDEMFDYTEITIAHTVSEWVKYKHELLSFDIDRNVLLYVEKCLGLVINLISGYDPYIINRLLSIEVEYNDE